MANSADSITDTNASTQKPTVSLVVPCYNETANVGALYRRVRAIMEGVGETWEMVCVNDGSRDDTLRHLLALHDTDARVVVIDLSRNFGKEAALTAGLDYAQGQAVIPLDADCQDPPELIPALMARWREGFDVVNAVRTARAGETWVKRATAYLFYRLMNALGDVAIPPDVGDFRLIGRPALEALHRLPERRRFMKGLFAWVGFRTVDVPYARERRHAGHSQWNYARLWVLAVEAITSFSRVPLQLASYLGLLVALSAFLYGGYALVTTLIFGNPVKGYPSLMVTVLFLGGVQLMALGLIGEYLGRIYEETKQRPVYLVRSAWGSKDAMETPSPKSGHV